MVRNLARRTVVLATASALTLGIVVAVPLYNHVHEQQAFAAAVQERYSGAQAASDALTTAREAWFVASGRHERAISDGLEFALTAEAFVPRAEATALLFSQESVVAYREAVATFRGVIDASPAFVSASDADPVTSPVTLDALKTAAEASEEAYVPLLKKAETQTAQYTIGTREFETADRRLADARADVLARLSDLAAVTNVAGPEYVAKTYPKAEQVPQDAYTRALDEFVKVATGEQVDDTAAFAAASAYLDSFKALKASHQKVVENEQAAAAKNNAEIQSSGGYTNGSGQWVPTNEQDYPASPDESGSGDKSSGGGSAGWTDPSNSSGGSTPPSNGDGTWTPPVPVEPEPWTPPVSPEPEPLVPPVQPQPEPEPWVPPSNNVYDYINWRDCAWAGLTTGTSASIGSHISVPSDASWLNIWQTDTEWGADWECYADW